MVSDYVSYRPWLEGGPYPLIISGYIFESGGEPEHLLGSADWMKRNLDRRVETILSVPDRCSGEVISASPVPDVRTASAMRANSTPEGQTLPQRRHLTQALR